MTSVLYDKATGTSYLLTLISFLTASAFIFPSDPIRHKPCCAVPPVLSQAHQTGTAQTSKGMLDLMLSAEEQPVQRNDSTGPDASRWGPEASRWGVKEGWTREDGLDR